MAAVHHRDRGTDAGDRASGRGRPTHAPAGHLLRRGVRPGQACGDPLSWAFTGEALVNRFFDSKGSLVRIQVQVRESGTVTNLATGEVVDLPRTAFTERVLLVEGGSIIIQDVGLSVRVTGPEDFLLDVGRFVVRLNPNELLQSSGQHPIREINPFSVNDPALLGAFCDLVD
jgi:hypothetical protein